MKKLKKLLLISLILLLASSVFAQDYGDDIFVAVESGGSSYDIDDAFSSDTGQLVDLVSGSGFSVSGGVASPENDWAPNYAYYNTDLGDDDHCFEADVEALDSYSTGLMFRVNPTNDTGYIVFLSSANERVYLHSYSGGADSWVANVTLSSETIDSGTTYTMRVVISGTSIDAYIDLNDDGDYNDTDENPISTTDSTYSSGHYVGFHADTSATLQSFDNAIGDASSCD